AHYGVGAAGTRTAYAQNRIGLEADGAFRTDDRALVQIIEARRAARAYALLTKISAGQQLCPKLWGRFKGGPIATKRGACQREVVRPNQGLQDCRRPSLGLSQIIDVSTTPAPSPLTATLSGPLIGSLRVPGDKSISHRALIL